MNAFLPLNVVSLWIAAAIVLTSLAGAFVCSRTRLVRGTRLLAWTVPIAAVLAIESLLPDEPPGFRMVVLILAVLYAMKGGVSVESTRGGDARLRPLAWFAFAAGWPGMRPVAFADVPGRPKRDAVQLLARGAACLLAGLAFVGAARWIYASEASLFNNAIRLATSLLLLLPGLSLILHFGIFTILAGLWRLVGADCRPLFCDPLRSKSLTEFWSRRWNLAFSEMTALVVFRPLRFVFGKGIATFAAFLFSGALHEMAISLPVHAGYGLPLLYFVLQGVAVTWETRLAKLGRPIDSNPWFGRIWSIAWLVLPLPMLFHSPFIKGIVLPIIGG